MRSAKRWISSLGLACVLALAASSAASAAEYERYELASVEASVSTPQAGAHADVTIAFTLDEKENEPYAFTKEVQVSLPPGVIGNPQGLPRCSPLQFGGNPEESACPVDSQVGVTEVDLGGPNPGGLIEPVYNLDPAGESVARLGFFAGPYPTMIDVSVNPVNYSLIADIEGISAAAQLISAKTTLWGVPAAESHNRFRITPEEAENGTAPTGGRASNLPPVPFMTNPTACTTERAVTVTATNYQIPSHPSVRSAPFPTIVGCQGLNFGPQLTVIPTTTEAAAATGIEAELRIPQDETPQGRGTSQLKSASVLLPPGLTINPSAGDGLEACSVEQVGLERDEDAHCPNGAKIGSAEIDVPALEHVLQGSVYQRTPEPGNLFRFWLVADELGAHLKLPAEIKADPVTGQLTTVFAGLASLGGNPQVPVASLKLHIFGGPRAPLSTPGTCGTYQTNYTLTPWSGNAPATGQTPMQINSGCSKGGFAPTLKAGTVNPKAGTYSPFVLELGRQDGEANPSTVSVELPKGLLANLGQVPLCAAAAAASGSCGSDSQIGTVNVAAGVGAAPLWIPQPGKSPTALYLAGPYKGAPYSLVIKVPAQAGPFDLGTVITRAAVQVDPTTTEVTVSADPLPQILEGVPVSYRNIYVSINRPNFTINPTNCDAMQVSATVVASSGAIANPDAGFQASNCARLSFAPKLSLKLSGQMKRTGNPALKAVLTYPEGENANISRVQTVLPKTEFIDNSHISNPCTRVQFAAGACPAKSILGKARAWSPLLNRPLEGPVYFRSNGGERKLPDIVADLNGQIHVVLVGFIDSVKTKGSEASRVRNTFATVPDAPVSRFILELSGGKKGLLENNTSLCSSQHHATVKMTGQNGKDHNFAPVVRTTCSHKKKNHG